MNTTELVIEIARRSKTRRVRLTRQQVEAVMDLLLDILREELTQPGGEIRLREFGVFTVEQAKKPGGSLRVGNTSQVRRNMAGQTYFRVRFKSSRTLLSGLR